jgi:hypothetical protein
MVKKWAPFVNAEFTFAAIFEGVQTGPDWLAGLSSRPSEARAGI